MEQKALKIMHLLCQGEYITAETMAQEVGVSVKTVRLRIKDLNHEGQLHGFCITSKPRFGYSLKIIDQEKFGKYMSEDGGRQSKIPGSLEERIDFLLAYLICQKDYIKIDDLCQFLYISRTTLTESLKHVERLVKQYGIEIDRKPNFGLKMKASEYDFRRCIGDYFVRRNVFGEWQNRKNRELESLGDTVLSLMKEKEIHMTETGFETFIYHVYVAVKRIRSGFPIDGVDEKGLCLSREEWEFTDWLVEILSQRWQMEIDKKERDYIALYLAGKRTVNLEELSDSNFVINEEITRISEKILEVLFEEFNVDLRGDFHIRMLLNSHLVPFHIRIKYGISNTNQLLSDIKRNYGFPYAMASRIREVLEEEYQKSVSEDEAGYFATIFALALEEKKGDQRPKSNILIVCNSGKGSSRLLMAQYRQEFGDYLDHIYICDMVGLNRFDFTAVDYVFTTVPIRRHIPVPIMEVGCFLEESDKINVKNVLRNGKKPYLSSIYRPDRFFAGLKGNNKEEVLENFCRAIEKREKLPDHFLESVLIRENLGQTDFGNHVAMPHPYKILEEETKVWVAVLEKPVIWTKNQVSVLFLTSIGRTDEDLPYFYEATAGAMQDRDGMERLAREKKFEILMEILENTT